LFSSQLFCHFFSISANGYPPPPLPPPLAVALLEEVFSSVDVEDAAAYARNGFLIVVAVPLARMKRDPQLPPSTLRPLNSADEEEEDEDEEKKAVLANETRDADDAVAVADDAIIFLAATVTFVLVIVIILLLCVGE